MHHSDFVHLHLHTQYSLLDGAITIEELCKKAKEYKMPAVAMTDHGNMFGAVEFYQKMEGAGIKPIIGCEMYLESNGSRFTKEFHRGHEPYHHLILLAMNRDGYQNLCQLITAGYLEGFYYKPRIDKGLLREKNAGLIATSGCLSGEIARLLLAGKRAEAEKAVSEYLSIFGDRYYLEIQAHSLPDQKLVNEAILDLGQRLSVPVIATGDCHYLKKEDATAHEALLCIQTGTTLKDETRMRFGSDEFYFKSAEEMAGYFPGHQEVLHNTVAVAQRCNLSFDFKTYYFPKFEPPPGKNLDQFLEEATLSGFEERWKKRAASLKEEEKLPLRQQYEVRIHQELKMIRETGFAGYFLIVADFINYAKGKGIPVGPGRGSAAGSLVAYCLKITDIDPIPYDLLFERFLNPERVTMPDMDIDFCIYGRDEIIRYVQQKYGNVSQIITFGKMKAKAVIRDVGRVMAIPYGDVDKIAKLIPNTLNITLDEALRAEPRLSETAQKSPVVGKLLTIARSLEGLTRHASTHAAGVVISDQPLTNFMPLYKGTHDEIITQFDMKAIEKIGLIKFDFLGLKTLTVIDEARKIIKRTRGLDLDINDLPLDDPEVYQLLSRGDTSGVFQLESSGMRDLLTKLKPSVFPDMIAVVALYRPGPLGSGMVDDFINRKHGKVNVRYELPELEGILKDTYGVIVYQEQVMKIASKLANFSLGEADLLRRAMGKKNSLVMAEQRDRFLKGAHENKIPPKKAEKIFDLMAKFAEYGFNKSHSAAYALIAYQTAYLKAHFTVEYMAALLTQEMGNTDKVMLYITDARAHSISVLPPDVNEGYSGFSVVGTAEIRFGLTAVKNAGSAAIDSLIEVRRKEEKFHSFLHFLESIDHRKINRRVIESLIKCGTFDSMGITRAACFEALPLFLEKAAKKQRDTLSGQENLFGAIKETHDDAPPVRPEWPMREKLAHEKESLGFYITGHPLREHEGLLRQKGVVSNNLLADLPDGKMVRVGGVVSSLREVVTKNGDRMGFVTLEDLTGLVTVIVFPELFKKYQTLLKSDQPIIISGELDVGEEEVKVIAKDLAPLLGGAPSGGAQTVTSSPREVHIRLLSPETRKEQLENLKKLLTRFRGPCPLYVHLIHPSSGETILSLPEELRVEPTDELLASVNNLFGGDVVQIQ
ncbi:MAG: DNA polymerase III subunit alpha [Deltaproteobacteria bacterium]|nr:DNA polymerase III subunit alpha [Deltaproteobacteria bacterium]